MTDTLKPQVDFTYGFLHGACMMLAWMVLGTLSLITARRRKLRGNKAWFTQHWLISGGTLVLSVVGLLFGFAQKNWVALEWDWQHQYIGIMMFVMAGVQGTLGLVAHCAYDPKRTTTPVFDYVHHIIGRLLWLVAIYQCWVGLTDALVHHVSDTVGIVLTSFYAIWVALCLSFLVFTDVSSHPSHHDEPAYHEVGAEVLAVSSEFKRSLQ